MLLIVATPWRCCQCQQQGAPGRLAGCNCSREFRLRLADARFPAADLCRRSMPASGPAIRRVGVPLRVGMLSPWPQRPAVQSAPDRLAAVGLDRELAVPATTSHPIGQEHGHANDKFQSTSATGRTGACVGCRASGRPGVLRVRPPRRRVRSGTEAARAGWWPHCSLYSGDPPPFARPINALMWRGTDRGPSARVDGRSAQTQGIANHRR